MKTAAVVFAAVASMATVTASPAFAAARAVAMPAPVLSGANTVKAAAKLNAAAATTGTTAGAAGATARTAGVTAAGMDAPVVSDIAVSPLSPARGVLTVTPAITSDVTIKTVKTTITGPNGRSSTAIAVKAPWTVSWSSVGQNGTATIAVVAIDTAGNTGTLSTSVTIDNTAPSSLITMPRYVSGTATVALDSPSEDTAKMDVYVGPKAILAGEATSAPWSIDWSTAGLIGPTAVKVVTTDAAGNVSTTFKTVSVDNAGPAVTWSAPAAAAALHGVVTIVGGASDLSGVTQVDLLDGDTVLGTDTTAPYAIPVDTAQLSGNHTLSFRATDSLGQTTTISRTFFFDNTSPVISDMTVSLTGTGENLSRGTVQISPTVTDDAGVKSVKMLVTLPTGRTVTVTSPKAPWNLIWNSVGVNGPVTAVVTAADAAGNTTTATTSFTVDNVAPSAVAELPATVTGTQAITLSNPADDTARMDVYVGSKSTLIGTVTGGPWTIDWDTSGLNGPTPVKIVTTDLAGNTTTVSRTIFADNAGPALGWISPGPAVKPQRGLFTVTASASDHSGVTKLEVLDGDTVLATDTASPWSMVVDGSAWNGPRELMIRATDGLGLVSTVYRTFTFDNTAPQVSIVDLNGVSRGLVTLAPNVSDDLAVASVRAVLTLPSGKTVLLNAGKAPYSMVWNSIGVTGTVTGLITVTDTAGNVATTTTSFAVDNTTTTK